MEKIKDIDNYLRVMLKGAIRAITNKPNYESFNTIFMENIKSCQKNQLIYHFPIKCF